jgi:hypothetical protein
VSGAGGGRFGSPDQFAAAIASPGGWTPDLAKAYFDGLKHIADGMQAEADAIVAGMVQMGDSMSDFQSVVMQRGFGISPNQGEGPSSSVSNLIPIGTTDFHSLQQQAANMGLAGQATQIAQRFYDGQITMAQAISALTAFLAGNAGVGQAPGGFDYGQMRRAVAEGVAMAMGGQTIGGMANSEMTNQTRRTVT